LSAQVVLTVQDKIVITFREKIEGRQSGQSSLEHFMMLLNMF